MNTIKINEKDLEKLEDYKVEKYFENFIFNEFKIVLNGSNYKEIYKIKINDNINEVFLRIIKGSKYYDCEFSFADRKEEYEFIEKPKGELLTILVNNISREVSKKEEIIDKLDDIFNLKILIITQLKQYIMNESYKRIAVQKVIEHKVSSEAKSSNRKNKKTQNNVVYLLNDIVTYVSSNHRKFNITCECWNVRGHFRHYKNGKIVWINSYEKGEKRNSGNNVKYSTYVI